MKCPRKKGAEGAEKSSQVLKRTTSVSSAPLRNIAVSTEMYSASGVDTITSQIRDCIAPEFSSESSYSEGDLCIKDGILYCCSVNHLGEWNASHFIQTSVSSKLTENSVLSPIYSQTPTFSEWTFSGTSPSSGRHWEVVWDVVSEEYRLYEVLNGQTWEDTVFMQESVESINDDLVTVVFPTTSVTATRMRTDIIGYTLGSQSDKPLQPKGDYLPIDANTREAINDLANLTETDNLATVKSRINSLMDILKGAITTASIFILSAILSSPLFGATQLNAFNPTNEIYSAQEVNEYVKTQALSRAEAEIGYTDWKVTSTNAEVISSSVNWQQESSSWVIDVTTLEDGVENQYSYTKSPSTGLETEITFIFESSEPAPVVITNPKTVITFGDGTSQEYDWSGEINQSTMVNEGLFDNNGWTTNITSIVIGTNVTSIGYKAFYGCFSLKSITIGNSVTSIGEYAFSDCSGLTTITCNALTAPTIQNSTFGNGSADYIGRNTYNTGNNKLIVPAGATGYDSSYWADPLQDNTKCGFTLEYSSNIREPLTARTSGVYTFTATRIRLRPTPEMEESWNANIEALQFKEWYPDGSVTNKNQWTTGLNYAFDSTSKTAEITRNLNITGSVVIPPYVDYDDERYTVTSIGDEAFRGCSSLTSVVIPNSVTNIGYLAFFNCRGLTSMTLGNSVTSIEYQAFSFCSSLTSITIPNSVTTIGANAFQNCSSLASLTIPESITSIGYYAFSGCSSLTFVMIPSSVTSIGDYAFSRCTSLTSVTIPNSVMSIGFNAFWDCTSLTSVTIPDSVTDIWDNAFFGCSGLTSITIPNSVTSIHYQSFQNCSGLTSVMIPDSVTSIGASAFRNCTKLSEINFGSKPFQSIPTLSDINAFNNVPTTCKFIIPDENYDAWISANNWSDLVSSGYQFIKYSDWEPPHRYEVPARKTVAMFILPVNNDITWDIYTDFELKASTNNFTGSTEDAILQYYSQSEIANMGSTKSPVVDKMHLFTETSFLSGDNRKYKYIGNTLDYENILNSVIILVDTSCLKRHPENNGNWLSDDNGQLIWCYCRYKSTAGDKIPEYEYDSDKQLWRPIAPVKWFSKIPDWAAN